MALTTHEALQSTCFFEILQNSKTLDLRDNRGKVHDMALVLLGVLIALLRKRDGNLSSIHRSMENTHSVLLEALYIDNQPIISRSHLPILLKKVCVETFEALLFEHFGIRLSAEEKAWFSVDGKELRGTILTGDTRGEAIVQAVRHTDGLVSCQGYYNGSKESERPCVIDLLTQMGLTRQSITLDALHLTPATLSCIAQSGGSYIVGLKENQAELYKDMQQLFSISKSDYQYDTEEKGHGRLETRHYKTIDVAGEYFDKRWDTAQFATVVEVKRTRAETKKAKYSVETSYYMCNIKAIHQAKAEQICTAIRGHWSVEVNNHIRDVSFKEDALQTIFKTVAQPLAIIRTLIINVLKKEKIKNIVAKLEEFADDFSKLIQFLKTVKIL